VTSVLRAAGYTCIDNYDDDSYDLQALVKTGRKAAGEAVCAPLAALYADLERGVDEFVRRKQEGDPRLAGKRRLVLIDAEGPGPCRQGQYPGLHRLFFHRSPHERPASDICNSMPGGGLFQFLVVDESEGYSGCFEEWVMLRIYQGVILKGILQSMLFKGAAGCRDYAQYQQFMTDYRALQAKLYRLLESFAGPDPMARSVLRLFNGVGWASIPLKYFFYRLHGREFSGPIREFARRWIDPRPGPEDELKIQITGEGYMRLSQAEEIFRILLGELGFRRFKLELTPILSFLELLIEEGAEKCRSELAVARARRSRTANAATGVPDARLVRDQKRKLRTIKLFRFLLRQVLARPLYRAGKLQLPLPTERAMEVSRELLPTRRPLGELAPFVGEALLELHHGVDVILNVAPNGCMVSSMGEVLTPRIKQLNGASSGRIQTLVSAQGDVDDELLTLAVLKAMGPRRYYQVGLDTNARATGTSFVN
jgi:hypothetical protein